MLLCRSQPLVKASAECGNKAAEGILGMFGRGELIQMLDRHKKWILVLVASAVLLGGILLLCGIGVKVQGASRTVIIGALLLLGALALLAFTVFSSKSSEKTSDNWEKKILLALIVLGVLAVGGTFVWIGSEIKLQEAGPELTLPLVVIVGVVVLLITLALVAVTFSVLNMSDKGQALALPEGSVRAVIALMLLLVFAIAAIFLYSNVSNGGKLHEFKNVTKTQLTVLQKQGGVVHFEPSSDTASAADGPFTVYFRDINSQAGDDIAKQLIVLLGTLVTAVASFYFGSSSVATARDAADRARLGIGGPNAASVSPSILKADGSSQPLAITGANLGNVNDVKLVSADGKTSISADAGSVKASAATVTCNMTVPAATPAGPYDVVVADNANNSSTVPKGVAINPPVATPAVPPTASPSAPQVTAVSPNPASPDGSLKQFTITGSNLGKTNKVTFELTNEAPIAAVKVVPQGEDKLVCDITIPTGTKLGKWDVVVSDGTTSTKLPEGLQIA
jgi:hypothetical protein